MGYICPECGEALPDDTPCPCGFEDDDTWDEDEEEHYAESEGSDDG